MGKQYNPRASQVRRQQAVAAKQRRAEEARAAWWKEHRWHLIAAVVAALLLIAAILAADSLSKPAEIRDVTRIEENWVVIDTANKVTKRYHHPASFDGPEGYVRANLTVEEASGTKTDYLQSFYYQAENPAAEVTTLLVNAGYDLTAGEYVERLLSLYDSTLNEGSSISVVGEPFTATVAGEEAQCVYLSYDTAEGSYGSLFCAFDAPSRVCVYAVLSGSCTTGENVQTQEQLLAEAQTLLKGLTIIR